MTLKYFAQATKFIETWILGLGIWNLVPETLKLEIGIYLIADQQIQTIETK